METMLAEQGETEPAYEAMIRAAALGLPLYLTPVKTGCYACRDAAAVQRMRTALILCLRERGHFVKLGPSWLDGRLTIDIHCMRCPFLLRAHFLGIEGQPAIVVDALVGMGRCQGEPGKA